VELTDPSLLQRGDVLKVLPNSCVPTDGVVVGGASAADESSLTGESFPVDKSVGSVVYGGTTNKHGLLFVKVTRTVAHSAVANIARAVTACQSNKPSLQKVTDRIASRFVPAILVVAALTFILWFALASSGRVAVPAQDTPLSLALTYFLSVLVISCPCAIALSVPPPHLVGATVAAKKGALINGGRTFEILARVTHVMFDKTGSGGGGNIFYSIFVVVFYFNFSGTLTTNKPTICNFEQLSKSTPPDQIFSIAATVASATDHPVARAVAEFARSRAPALLDTPTEARTVVGRGVCCHVAGREVVLVRRLPLFYYFSFCPLSLFF
jgi:P-type Cu+ transporter